ncbi:hypothetical protein AVEN_227845-1 [Araneus ventricosus]|uniref:Uncharacterized protein n=1 Tax=Araneus ventricosus TaxID=182803 RepID=A0A4Y2RQX2_ARAVE|nr:hypothetical protein AVEN_227845-1 [Araneus ventricosus]
MKTEDNQNKNFQVPKIDFKAKDYFALINWKRVGPFEPPLLMNVPFKKIEAMNQEKKKNDQLRIPVKLRSNDLSFYEFRPKFALFPVVGTGRIDVARGLFLSKTSVSEGLEGHHDLRASTEIMMIINSFNTETPLQPKYGDRPNPSSFPAPLPFFKCDRLDTRSPCIVPWSGRALRKEKANLFSYTNRPLAKHSPL